MKTHTKEQLEASRPQVEKEDAIQFCLDRLYEDKEHYIEDEVVKGLTFEELIGALLLAKE